MLLEEFVSIYATVMSLDPAGCASSSAVLVYFMFAYLFRTTSISV
jgi:hypothetical protein